MKKTLITLVMALCALGMRAQDDKVLMTIDGKPVMLSEFQYIYEKNSQEAAGSQKSLEEYLDLFVNFKLKVTEAEHRGIDTTQAFIKELKGYRAQATPKYLTDNDAMEALMRRTYEWQKVDRRVAHIAIECPMSADSATVEQALARINDARERVTTGKKIVKGKGKKARTTYAPKEDFKAVASEVSTDPSVKESQGELGWISPFRFVYPFEKAVYTTPVGEVTEVFRSPYGFHIALVEEERQHEEVQASHIMKTVPRGDSVAAARAKVVIDSIYQLAIQPDAKFDELARELSDDKGSAMRGGSLGWFGHGAMVKPFEDAVFGIQNVGDITKPFESRFGWHIAKLDGKRGTLPYDEVKDDIKKRVQRDERSREVKESFIAKTCAEYNLPAEMSDAEVMAYADEHLEAKYPELARLVKEYHDGILLFDVSLEEVWDKAAKDTAGLEAFFAANKANYVWEQPRFKGIVVYCKDKNTLKAAQRIVKQAQPDSVMSYLKRLNTDSVRYVRMEQGLWLPEKNAAIDKYGFKNKKTEFVPDTKLPYVFVSGKVLKGAEVYTDDRNKVTSDYQEYLDARWIEALKQKYPVVINREVLQ
ncbi:MAG: peptidylprolyl isomerase [Paludibacteraceae bacterium]|nr:peptidylprolyl isomerase [Paludibacteraceae bacterium]